MIRYKVVFLLLIIALNISCSKKGVQSECGYEIDLLSGVMDSLGYSLFTDSIKYINLETTDSCLIGEITDMAISADRMFVFDKRRQTVWVFNQEGEFLSKIFKQGNGPGEYIRIVQFEYDEKNDQIVLLTWGSQLLYYTPEGEFLKTVKLGFSLTPSDFKILPQGGFIFSQAGWDKPTAGIYYVNDSGKEEQILVKRKENHLVYINSDWELCSYDSTICFISPNFENIVYHYENRELVTKYPFYMKPELKHDYMETVSMQHFEDFIRTGYVEGEKWILATYWSSVEDVRTFLFSKEKKKYWIGKYLVNDVDGVDRNANTSVSGNNTFVFWREHENPDENPIIQVLYLK
mgnify:FL=1